MSDAVWCNGMGRSAMGTLMAELRSIRGAAAQRAYLFLHERLHGFGPIPIDHVPAAAWCTAKSWLRVWPAIEHFFDVENGYLHRPGLDRAPLPGRQTSEPVSSEQLARKEKARRAAEARWGRVQVVTGGDPPDAPEADQASDPSMAGHAQASDPSIADHAQSTSGGIADRADRAAGAHARPPAPADSPSSSESSESEEKKEGIPGGEGGGVGGLGEGGEHASEHAPANAPEHVADHAHKHAGRFTPPSPRMPLPADWWPSEAGQRLARDKGYDLKDIVSHFRSHYRALGKALADWNEAFVSWVHKQPQFDRRQSAPGATPRRGNGSAEDTLMEMINHGRRMAG